MEQPGDEGAQPMAQAPPAPSAPSLEAGPALLPAPSVSSLELELPISPVLALPLDPAGSSDPSGHGAGTEADAPGEALPLRSASSRQLPAVKRPGTEVWAFGRGDLGQLGSGGTSDALAPGRVEGLRGRDIVNLAAGPLHTAAVTSDGELYVCGSNEESQLGLRGKADVLAPTRVGALESSRVLHVACGGAHTLAVADGGAVLACGSAEFGQLGLGPGGGTAELPRPLASLRGHHVVRVAAGASHSLALSATGGVFACGNGTFGALGRGNNEGSDVPRPISRLWPLGVVQVACGENHSAALTADGRVLTWGRGRYGALGHGDYENRAVPRAVDALRAVAGRQLACGGDHTVLLDERGEVWAWGRGTWGQTGLAHTDNTCLPQRVRGALLGRRVVQVAAGARHTLCLAADNALLAFGSNESGQLAGAAVVPVQPTPQPVLGLPGSPILFVAAGGDTSAVVLDRDASPQAGAVGPCSTRLHGDQCCPVEVPHLLALAQRAAAAGGERQALDAVLAGVECVFGSPGYLLAAFSKRRQQEARSAENPSAQHAPQLGGRNEAAPEADSGQGPPHGGAAAGEPGGQQQRGDGKSQAQGRQQGPGGAGAELDVALIGDTLQALLRLYEPEVVAALGSACVRLLDMVERFLNTLGQQEAAAAAGGGGGGGPTQPADLGWVAPTLFVLLQSPLNGDPGGFGGKLLLRISRVASVTVPARERLGVRAALTRLLSALPPEVLAARCVRPAQRYIDSCVAAGLGATRMQVMMAGVLLDVLRQASLSGGAPLPDAEFASRRLSEHANLQQEYLAWRQNTNPAALCSLCQMPYLLTPEAKSFIMHGEAAMQQQQHLSAAAMQAFFQGVPPAAVAFLHIRVRRERLVEDALNSLAFAEPSELKKPLRVAFLTGGVPEPAQDEGGVTKEFFQLIVPELLKPEYAMFSYNEVTRCHWFSAASLEAEVEYALVGAVLGLAIYNGVILDVHFPPVLYKKLLGLEPGFEDLRTAFPDLGRGLQQLLDFEGDVEGVFCRTFTAEYEFFGEVREVELRPGGREIPVTADNRRQYVELYTRWVLVDAVERQFRAFRGGFLKVCGGPALTLFSPSELELLVCGLPHLDFEALQGAAKYEGYSGEHPEVRWFWELLQSFSLDQKRAFLRFTTGSDRAPVGGLAKLPLLIQRAGPDTEHLPTSHTCFNSLLLPEYSSKEKLQAKLLTAIGNAQGFGLQ